MKSDGVRLKDGEKKGRTCMLRVLPSCLSSASIVLAVTQSVIVIVINH